MKYQGITGTFLNEVTYDIPSQNWGPREWEREFDTFVEAGIDTAILIAAGRGARLAYPSTVIPKHVRTMPVYQDLVKLYLDLAEPRDINIYLGLYDSNYYWHRYDWETEVNINLDVIAELHDMYGDSPAFGGWYLPHETADSSLRILDINTALATRIRAVDSKPILVSPYFQGLYDMVYGFANIQYSADPRQLPRTPDEHVRVWREIFRRYEGLVDQCAFQDGTIADPLSLGDWFGPTKELAHQHGIQLWCNMETFDRNMPLKFPPADWRDLAYKLDAIQPHVDKIITFEFSHFLSPNSSSPGAAALYARYNEHMLARQA